MSWANSKSTDVQIAIHTHPQIESKHKKLLGGYKLLMNMWEEYSLVYSWNTEAMVLNLYIYNEVKFKWNVWKILTFSEQLCLKPPNNQAERLALNLMISA